MRVKDGSDKILRGLDADQLAAVTAPLDKPAVVLAGPGSGKTRVIVQRVAWMLDQGVLPREVVAITFSRKAADELIGRLAIACPAVDTSKMMQGTIHAFCRLLLKEWGMAYQKIPDWKIRKAIEPICDHAGIPVMPIRWWVDHTKMQPMTEYSYVMNHATLKDMPDLQKVILASCQAADDAMNGEVTFTDMLRNVWKAVQKTYFQEKAAAKYKYVLVDEGQDVFEMPMAILRRVFGSRIFMVGDADQLLYRFLGATPEINLNTIDEPYRLKNNYRSRAEVIDASDKLIKPNHADKFIPSKIRVKGEGRIAFQLTEDPLDEAVYVKDLISSLLERKSKVFLISEICVSARTNAQLSLIERELIAADIPYRILGNGGFFEQRHIQAVTDRLSSFPANANPEQTIIQIIRKEIEPRRRRLGQMSVDASQDDNIAQDLQALVDNAKGFVDIKEFRAFVEKAQDKERNHTNNAVVLSTIHKLKGTEFEVMISIGWNEGTLPHYRSWTVDPNAEVPIPLLTSVKDERCIAYVAVTRAKSQVYITYNKQTLDGAALQPSRFISDIQKGE